MAEQKSLTRAQLAKFLPDAESIKAFEKLFELAGDTTPGTVLELSYLVDSLKSRTQDAIRKLSEASTVQPQSVNLSRIEKRLADLEGKEPRRQSLTSIESRLNELEMQAARRPNYDALLRRIENLEQLVGV